MQVRSKPLLSRSVSSRNPQYGRIQPGLWLSSGRAHRQGPEPLAHACGKILQLFWQGPASPGTHAASWLAAPPARALLLLQLLLRGCVGAGGPCLRQGRWPGAAWLRSARGHLTCGIISKALLCVTWLRAAGFVPGYFGSAAERLPGTRSWPRPRGAFARSCPGRSPGTAAGDEPCGSGRGYPHPASHRGLPTPLPGTASTRPGSRAGLTGSRPSKHSG